MMTQLETNIGIVNNQFVAFVNKELRRLELRANQVISPSKHKTSKS